jgi:enamine deaminase RidA (YjgF/YER057c/UK114 family)
VLFGRLVLAEPASASSGPDGPTVLQQVTAQAYAHVFAALDGLGYPNLLRIWNYFAEINRATPQGERYHEFNTARRQAFLRARRVIEGQVPAACALGSAPGSPLVIYFLASASAARSLENPRQVSAFRYPAEYGPDSPTFSRAVLAAPMSGNCLLTSGTASILGHSTAHGGNVAAQTRESISNIVELVAEANRVSGARRYSIEDLQYKVYVRHATDLSEIRRELVLLLPARCPITYLQADICRRDLLVEIEAVGSATPDTSADSR